VRWGAVIAWGTAGAALLVAGLGVSWLSIPLGGIRFNPGWVALVYAAVLLARNLLLRPHLDLTQRELHDWGEALGAETVRILSLHRQGRPAADIADLLERDRGLPREVSLKYMIALARYGRRGAGRTEGP